MSLPTSGPLSLSAIRNEQVNLVGTTSTYALRGLSANAGFGSPDSVSEFYGYGIATSGLILQLDGSITSSYSGSGTGWTDLSGSGNNMTMSGTVPFAGSGQQKYFSYNGTANFWQGNNNFTGQISNAITICSVVNITNLSQRSVFFSHSGLTGQISGYVFEAGGVWGSTLRWYCAGTGGESNDRRGTTTTLSANTNYLVSVTYDRNTGVSALYVNQALIPSTQPGSNLVAADWANSPVPNLLGSHGGGYAIYAYMRQYMVLTYNRALTSTEIGNNYNALRPRFGL